MASKSTIRPTRLLVGYEICLRLSSRSVKLKLVDQEVGADGISIYIFQSSDPERVLIVHFLLQSFLQPPFAFAVEMRGVRASLSYAFWALLPIVYGANRTCESYGMDFQNGGLYFQNATSKDPFTFVSQFQC